MARRKRLGTVLGLLSMVALFLIVGYLVVSYFTLFRGLREGVTRAIEQSSPVTTTTGAEPSTVAMTPAATPTTTTTTLPPGLTWEQVPLDEIVFPPGSMLFGATTWGDQVVVVGQSGGVGDMRAAVWLSENGRDWTAHVLDPTDVSAARDVAVWRDSVVVVGMRYHEGFKSDALVWISQNGSDWTQVSEDESVFKGGEIGMSSIAQWEGGLVAVGFEVRRGREGNFLSSDTEVRGRVWISPDGVTWQHVSNEDVFGGPGKKQPTDVAAWGHGLVVIGREFGVFGWEPVVWHSTDGEAWSKTRLQGGPKGGAAYRLLATERGLVAVGEDVLRTREHDGVSDIDAAVWTSPDGVEWYKSKMVNTDILGGQGDQGMVAVSQWDGGTIAMGWDGIPGGGAVGLGTTAGTAIWIHGEGKPWERVPVDADLFGPRERRARLPTETVPWRGGVLAVGYWVSTPGVADWVNDAIVWIGTVDR